MDVNVGLLALPILGCFDLGFQDWDRAGWR
jgi:hypothetical protein